MKKILTLVVLALFLSCGFAFAKQDNKVTMPVVKFNGSKYSLYYSAKSTETGGFINEYYKPNQTYTSWDELIGVHHYPTAFYPIEHARDFKDFLNNSGGKAFLEVYDEENTAILYFIVISDKRLPIILEFNVFKYQKSPICGTVALQYAKRYLLNNGLEVDDVKKDFAKSAVKYVKQVEKLDIPDIVTFEIEKGQYVHLEDLETLKSQKEEKVKSKKETEEKPKKVKNKKNKTAETEIKGNETEKVSETEPEIKKEEKEPEVETKTGVKDKTEASKEAKEEVKEETTENN